MRSEPPKKAYSFLEKNAKGKIDQDASEEAKSILQEIKDGMEMVPNIMMAYANHTPLLKANWEKMKSVMIQGNLPKKVKGAIARGVSADNSC